MMYKPIKSQEVEEAKEDLDGMHLILTLYKLYLDAEREQGLNEEEKEAVQFTVPNLENSEFLGKVAFAENREVSSFGDWIVIEDEVHFLYVVLTHEGKSSENDQVLLPYSRLNDGKMYLVTLEPISRTEILSLSNKIKNKEHLNMSKLSVYETTEIKFEHKEPTHF